jgi:hypothetical protein
MYVNTAQNAAIVPTAWTYDEFNVAKRNKALYDYVSRLDRGFAYVSTQAGRIA